MSRFGSSTKQLLMCTPCVHRPNVTGKADAGKQFTWRRLRKWGNSGRSFVLSLFISWPWERVSYWSRTYFFIYWPLPAHRSFEPVSLCIWLKCATQAVPPKKEQNKNQYPSFDKTNRQLIPNVEVQRCKFQTTGLAHRCLKYAIFIGRLWSRNNWNAYWAGDN